MRNVKFKISVREGQHLNDCDYVPKVGYPPRGVPDDHAIDIGRATHITKSRCFAILRELARRTDEDRNDELRDNGGFSFDGENLVNEHTLRNALWEQMKSMHRPPRTMKELLVDMAHEEDEDKRYALVQEGLTLLDKKSR